jgi:hypothetical protein
MWIDIYTLMKCNPALVDLSERKFFTSYTDYLTWVKINYPTWQVDPEYKQSVLQTQNDYSST